jgi:hypothetical protein
MVQSQPEQKVRETSISTNKPSIMEHTYDASTQKAEAEGL